MRRYERRMHKKKKLTEADIERCQMLGLTESDIERIIPAGLDPNYSVHWHALNVAWLHDLLDELFAAPMIFIGYTVYEIARRQ